MQHAQGDATNTASLGGGWQSEYERDYCGAAAGQGHKRPVRNLGGTTWEGEGGREEGSGATGVANVCASVGIENLMPTRWGGLGQEGGRY